MSTTENTDKHQQVQTRAHSTQNPQPITELTFLNFTSQTQGSHHTQMITRTKHSPNSDAFHAAHHEQSSDFTKQPSEQFFSTRLFHWLQYLTHKNLKCNQYQLLWVQGSTILDFIPAETQHRTYSIEPLNTYTQTTLKHLGPTTRRKRTLQHHRKTYGHTQTW